MLCLRKFNGRNQNFENCRRFFLVFVKKSTIHTRDMEFQKQTIIISNEDDNES